MIYVSTETGAKGEYLTDSMQHSDSHESAARPASRILVIEDDDDLRQNLIDLLRFYHYQAAGAARGHDGITEASTSLPDLILLDIKLPDMTGYAVLRRLKATAVTKIIPVVVLSGYSEPDNEQRALHLGAAAYLTKPFNLSDLIAVIRHVLELQS